MNPIIIANANYLRKAGWKYLKPKAKGRKLGGWMRPGSDKLLLTSEALRTQQNEDAARR